MERGEARIPAADAHAVLLQAVQERADQVGVDLLDD
jgi:hypothetical protein